MAEQKKIKGIGLLKRSIDRVGDEKDRLTREGNGTRPYFWRKRSQLNQKIYRTKTEETRLRKELTKQVKDLKETGLWETDAEHSL